MASKPPATPPNSEGGIHFPKGRKKSFAYETRIKGWEEKLWIGRIGNYKDAQFIREAVSYYVGKSSVYLPNVNFIFPALECTCAAAPLTSRVMCSEYANSIARGPEFASQREEFIESVKKVARKEVKTGEVQRLLQQIREDENRPALLGAIAPHEEEDVYADQPMEAVDPQHLPLILASVDPGHRNADGKEAYVLGFDLSDSGSRVRLHSGLILTNSSWPDSCLRVPEDYAASPHRGREEFCSVTRDRETETLFDCPSALENFRVNFFAMGDAAED